MYVTEQVAFSETRVDGVRVCPRCGRPVAARDMKEYTTARAQLVVEKGLCVCPAVEPSQV